MSERSSLVQRGEGLQLTVAEGERDLTDTERTTLAQFRGRIEEIDRQLQLTTQSYELDAATAANIARITGQAAQVRRDPSSQWRSAGHCLWDYMHQRDSRDSAQRVQAFQQRGSDSESIYVPSVTDGPASTRAAAHMGTTAEATTTPSGGFGGLVVSPVVGPIIDLGSYGTPLLNALGYNPAPNGFSFMRPRIVDANFDTGVGVQTLEKAELASQPFNLTSDTVSLDTVGGYLNVSLQSETFIQSPDALDLVVTQLRRRLNAKVEGLASGELAKATKTIPLAADADAAAVQAAIMQAAAAVFTATKQMPTWLAMGPDGWARLGGLTDLAGRPMYPSVSPSNALGTGGADQFIGSTMGLRVVVTPGISGLVMYMGNSVSIEMWAYFYPLLQQVEPSVLGRQVAVAASIGAYQPPTSEAGPANTPPAAYEGVVKIGA
jgi:hypothetical protein